MSTYYWEVIVHYLGLYNFQIDFGCGTQSFESTLRSILI